jgi:hypothetical protein
MAVTNGYCTLAEVKSAARITDSTDDILLENCIEAASRRIDGYTGRFFYQKSATISFYLTDTNIIGPISYNVYKLPISDLVSVSAFKTDDDGDGIFETTWTANVDYRLEPLNVVLQNRPYRSAIAISGKTYPVVIDPPMPGIQITGVFGWPAVPDDIREACLIMSLRLFSRYNSPLGVAGFGEMGTISVRAVDPDVREMLTPYRLIAIA